MTEHQRTRKSRTPSTAPGPHPRSPLTHIEETDASRASPCCSCRCEFKLEADHRLRHLRRRADRLVGHHRPTASSSDGAGLRCLAPCASARASPRHACHPPSRALSAARRRRARAGHQVEVEAGTPRLPLRLHRVRAAARPRRWRLGRLGAASARGRIAVGGIGSAAPPAAPLEALVLAGADVAGGKPAAPRAATARWPRALRRARRAARRRGPRHMCGLRVCACTWTLGREVCLLGHKPQLGEMWKYSIEI
jgi:hypothetical protein